MRDKRGEEPWQLVWRKIHDCFGVDTRSLAFYRSEHRLHDLPLTRGRFLLGMVAIMDAIDRIPDLRAHYSDEGYVPRNLVLSKMSLPAYVSIHMANGTWQFALILFFVQVLLAPPLLLGLSRRRYSSRCF